MTRPHDAPENTPHGSPHTDRSLSAGQPGPSAPPTPYGPPPAPGKRPLHVKHPLRTASTAAAVTAAAVTAGTVLALSPPTAAADPVGGSVSGLLRELQSLYSKSETATEAYNGTTEKLNKQRSRARRADAALASLRSSLAEGRRDVGLLARRQYRQGGTAAMPPFVQLLLSRDPHGAFEAAHVVERAAGRQESALSRLTAGEHRQRRLTARADEALARQQQLTSEKKRRRDDVRTKLHAVEGKLAGLSDDQLARLNKLETSRRAGAQRQMAATVRLDDSKGGARRAPSEAGEKALRYALGQVGKPYAAGATGPRSYDCSGLTFSAWKHAGRSIPRTSQQQWRKLRHVSLKRLRPGDLIVYYKSATHVGMYVGAGKIVHAPRPGESVRVSPMAESSVRGAVRPDSGAKPQAHYRAPKLPG